MNLRELLLLTLLDAGCTREEAEHEAAAVVDRLTQPDVLDEFERRFITAANDYRATTGTTYFTLARRVLAHMLTETKEGTGG